MTDASPPGPTVNPAEVIDRNLSRYQVRVILLCSLVVLLDGIDTQVIGIGAPLISRELGIAKAAFGYVFSIGMLGATSGALLCGIAADRLGRRTILMAATTVFGLFTIATAFATDLTTLLLYRFGTGLGLGGAIPCFVALTSEYAPLRRRGTIVALLWAAFPLGAAVGALINSWIVGELGWRALFYIWGAAPVLVAIVHYRLLPESVRFLVARGDPRGRVVGILNRIEPGAVRPGQPVANEAVDPARTSPRELFGPALRVPSWSLSLTAFIVFGLLAVGASWMPTLLTPYGFDPSAAALVVACNGFGSFIGTSSAGWLVGRLGIARCLPPALVGAAAALLAVGLSTGSFPLLALASGCAGVFLGLSSSSMLVLAALIYPTHIRSTGLGWTSGVGRLGSVVAPLLVGAMVGAGWGIVGIMAALGVAAIAGVPLVLLLARYRRGAAA